jgi:ElaB/YqjD/DUF883 family membrane-anchored ribosome-binding protein
MRTEETKMNTETTYENADQAQVGARRIKNGAGIFKSQASGEIKNLIADIEDLIAHIADIKDADVARLRAKVETAVAAAKQGLSQGRESLARQAKQVASTTDDYVRGSPWQALGVAALLGAVIGVLASRRS